MMLGLKSTSSCYSDIAVSYRSKPPKSVFVLLASYRETNILPTAIFSLIHSSAQTYVFYKVYIVMCTNMAASEIM